MLLLVAMMFCSALDATAIRFEMDRSLKNADASFIGEDADDYSGYTVAGAGDVNGDGYDDILIGAYYDEDGGYRAGQTYLVLGSSSGPALDTDLSNADASFIGEEPYDRSGVSIAGAGDVNGDGYDDILIGASFNGDGGKDAGKAYLILGNSTGWTMDLDLSQADASFVGEASGDRAGCSVAGAGDVNSDGYDDFLIGAYSSDDGGKDSGQTYIFFGRSTGWAKDTDLSQADASIIGGWTGANTAFTLAGAGDVNGDDHDDIIIGGLGGRNAQETSIGITYLVLGRTSGWTSGLNLSFADASFLGINNLDFSATSISGAGDVNDDGYDDILIGARERSASGSDSGEAYLFFGKEAGWERNVSLADANASFWGEAANDHAGQSVAGVGDVNNDGYDDILIGASSNGEGASGAGQSYLVLGRSQGWRMNVSLSDVDASLLGEISFDQSGWSVAGAGDVNGDGYYDLLIGAYSNDEGGDYAGQTYLVLGHATPPRIQRDATYGIAYTGDPHTFNVTTSSSHPMTSVSVEFWYGDTGTHSNLSATLASGTTTRGTWLLDITIPSDSNETLHYVVYLADGTFTSSSDVRNVSVWDNDPPELLDDLTPSTATTGDDLRFAVNVSENLQLEEVMVEYWYGDSSIHFNRTLVSAGGDTWARNITAPSDSLDPVHYMLRASDAAGNVASTGARNVTVLDDDAPSIVDGSSSQATTGDPFVFKVHVTDNIGIQCVYANYVIDINMDPIALNMTAEEVSAGGNGTYMASIFIPSSPLPGTPYLGFNVVVLDTSLNKVTTPWTSSTTTPSGSGRTARTPPRRRATRSTSTSKCSTGLAWPR